MLLCLLLLLLLLLLRRRGEVKYGAIFSGKNGSWRCLLSSFTLAGPGWLIYLIFFFWNLSLSERVYWFDIPSVLSLFGDKGCFC
jgi:hypothetical protein